MKMLLTILALLLALPASAQIHYTPAGGGGGGGTATGIRVQPLVAPTGITAVCDPGGVSISQVNYYFQLASTDAYANTSAASAETAVLNCPNDSTLSVDWTPAAGTSGTLLYWSSTSGPGTKAVYIGFGEKPYTTSVTFTILTGLTKPNLADDTTPGASVPSVGTAYGMYYEDTFGQGLLAVSEGWFTSLFVNYQSYAATFASADNTANKPTYTWYNDNDTGFFRKDSGEVDFYSDGTKVWSFPLNAPVGDGQMIVWDEVWGQPKWVANAVSIAGGGTGVTTFGGTHTLLYTSATDTLTSLANGTTGQVLMATTASAPSWSSNYAKLTANTFGADQAMGGFKITGLGAPAANDDAATKVYVDAIGAGLHMHEEALVATTGDITLANSQTIEGVALVNPNRVLVKNQVATKDNGCYVVVDAAGWTRCTDVDTTGEVVLGTAFFITSGSLNANSSWLVTTVPATLGVDPMLFSTLSKSEAITAVAPLYRTVNAISLTQSEITGTGTLTSGSTSTGFTLDLTNSTKSGNLGAANGGTGVTSYTVGDILYASAPTTLSKLANVDGWLLTGGGTIPKYVRDTWTVYLGAGRCQGASATSFFNIPSGPTGVNPACVSGTNVTRSVLNYIDTGGDHTAQVPSHLTDDVDLTGDVKLDIYWNSSSITGNVIWSVSTVCIGPGDDPDPVFNAAQTVTTAAQGTTLYKQVSTIAALTTTGCLADDTLMLRINRNGGTGGDTLGATASLIAVEVKYFRKW